MGDTNVLMYAASTTPEEADKRSIARAILKRDDLVLSAQVLQDGMNFAGVVVENPFAAPA